MRNSRNRNLLPDELHLLSEKLLGDWKSGDERRSGLNIRTNAVMKEAIKKGNKNISLTTIGLRRRAKRPDDGRNRGTPPMRGIGAEGQAGPPGLAQIVGLPPKREIAEITIYHIEKNVAIDSYINKALSQTNELIRIANLSYYHQSKSEFILCNKELRLLKACGI